MFGLSDPLRAHIGRRVVAHLRDSDVAGMLAVVTRDHVVITEAQLLVPDRGDTRRVELDGEQHLPRSSWIQVAG